MCKQSPRLRRGSPPQRSVSGRLEERGRPSASKRALGLSRRELARRIGKDEKEVSRIHDPKHATKLPALTAALRVLGKRLGVG